MLRSLRTRILVGFGSLALTLLLVSAVAMASLSQLSDAVATILRENYASVIACEDMLEALERQDSAALFASTGHREIAASMLRDNRAAFEEAYAREAHNITLPDEGARVHEIDRRYREYSASLDRTLTAPGSDEGYFRELLPRFTALKGMIRDVLRINQASMEAADGRAKAIARRSVQVVFIVSALALLVAAWFARRVADSIVQPVAALTEVARAIGEGHLEHSVAAPAVTELAPLAGAFDKMLVQLREYRASSLGELLAAKDLANATVECMVDPVVVFGAAGEILLTNAAAETSFGLRVGSAEDLRAGEVNVPRELADARDRVLMKGEAVVPRSFSEAMRRASPEGERFYLVRAAPLRAEGAAKMRAIILAQDVTRFRRIDELKSDMVATVSHEFKTPLTSLRMATHMLLEDSMGPLTASQREIVTTARDDTERLRAMVDELLDLVRIEAEAGALRRTPIDPWKLLQTVADAHRVIAHEKQVELALDAREAVEPTLVDPEKLMIVLANLCSNAIRHSPQGGKVRLGTSTDATTLTFVVRDAGEGIPADELPRLFERTPNRRGGFGPRDQHGLGLTIAREIVLQHGGELTVQSAPGEGSAFTVALPRA